jgi:hypothetical protein
MVAQRAGIDVIEAHVWQSGEEFTVGVGDRTETVGDLPAGQLRSCGTGFECRERRLDVLLVLCFEMSQDRRLARTSQARFYSGCLGHGDSPSL